MLQKEEGPSSQLCLSAPALKLLNDFQTSFFPFLIPFLHSQQMSSLPTSRGAAFITRGFSVHAFCCAVSLLSKACPSTQALSLCSPIFWSVTLPKMPSLTWIPPCRWIPPARVHMCPLSPSKENRTSRDPTSFSSCCPSSPFRNFSKTICYTACFYFLPFTFSTTSVSVFVSFVHGNSFP